MPLIGAQGPGSNISWRGNLDEYPDSFLFPEIVDILPGAAATSIPVTITGINYKTGVTAVGSGCSIRVTPYNDDTQTYGTPTDFLPGNDENNPIIIRNNDKIELLVTTTSASGRSDYNKVYPVEITIGTRPAVQWSVTTYPIDDTPDLFSFTDANNLEVNTTVDSNIVTVTGVDEVVGVDIFISSSTGELSINGGTFGSTGRLRGGDTLQLRNTTSNFYNTNLNTTVQIGNFTATFAARTRLADNTIDDFNFTPVTDAEVNTTFESNTITISGADENLNGNNRLPISIEGGQYKIVRNGQIIQDFTDQDSFTQNGDEITVKIVSSSSYSTTNTVTLNVAQLTKTYTAETRVRPVDTVPDQFTFTDQIDVDRNRTITSNTVTLTGMTDFGDEGSASISGTNATFKVVRDGVLVRDYSSNPFNVRNGDQITLQITSSSNSLGLVSATFTVSGTNTFTVFSGVSGSTSDTWNVTSAQRVCTISTFSLEDQTGNSGELLPGDLASTSFTAVGFDYDCSVTVTTSNANSYLVIGERQGTSLSNVQPDDVIEVYMTTPYYDQTRTTDVTLTSSFGTSNVASWTIGPVDPPPPTLTLDAVSRSVPFVFPDGGTAVLTYEYNFVTDSSVTATGLNFNLSSISPNTLSSGTKTGTYTVENLVNGSNTFSLTVSNSAGSVTDNVTVIVGTPPPPTVSLCPSDTSSCASLSTKNKGDNIRLYWKTTNAVATESPDFATNNSQNGDVLITNLTEDNKIFTVSATGAGSEPVTVSATHQVDLRPAVTITSSDTSISTGDSIELTWSADYAESVVNTSGSGFSTTELSGIATVIPPKGNITYGITVEDSQGLQSSDSVTISVIDDVTVDDFRFNPSSAVDLNRSQSTTSEPNFDSNNDGTFSGTTVTGLSPSVNVTASVTNGVFDDTGGTTKTVQNGTTTSDLTIRVTAPNTYDTSKTATLNINGVTATYQVTTRVCVVENSTDTLDGMTFNTRRCFSTSGSTSFNELCFRNIVTATGQIGRDGNGTTDAVEFGVGASTWTVPAGVYTVTGAVIGGGGSGGRHRSQAGGGGGGGGAHISSWSVTPGQIYNVDIGEGGVANQGAGQNSFINRAGTNHVVAEGGGSGGLVDGGRGGEGGTANGGRGGNRRGEGSGSEGGHGGGAGSITGGTCASGSLCGGEGGNGGGGKGSNIVNGVCQGDNCRKGYTNGQVGQLYGGGGGGSSPGYNGGDGAAGRGRINWTINYPNYTKAEVVRKIADAYWFKGRPPRVSEIRNYYEDFRDNPATYPTLDDLYTTITGALGTWTNTTDNCGDPFPQSY